MDIFLVHPPSCCMSHAHVSSPCLMILGMLLVLFLFCSHNSWQLWEKEGLLEFQEERLTNSEDLELEMAEYINSLAELIKANKLDLPKDLKSKAYFQAGAGDSSQKTKGIDPSAAVGDSPVVAAAA